MTQKKIMHLDGDAFFVSVEMAKNPALRGKPVVTGAERGIASALSYEAKKLGITRAMPIFQVRREFPEVAVVESDYESYAVFSRRMMDIVRRFTDTVEEYSIDECFADFSHENAFLRNPEEILWKIKSDIMRELGISVSLGLGPTKVLAKTASKSMKPDGLVIIPEGGIPELLAKTPVDKVWGIGSATAFALRKAGVSTAFELAQKSLSWVEEKFSKPMAEMWYELNGTSVLGIRTTGELQKSIMKTRTFVPATRDRSYVFSELSKNIESAARRARELGLLAGEFSIYLKTRDFSYLRDWARLSFPTHNSFVIIREAERLFAGIFEAEKLYRATGVTLYGLVPENLRQDDLFGGESAVRPSDELLKVADRVNRKYGRSLVHLASSSAALEREERGNPHETFMPRGVSKRLSLPYLGEVF